MEEEQFCQAAKELHQNLEQPLERESLSILYEQVESLRGKKHSKGVVAIKTIISDESQKAKPFRQFVERGDPSSFDQLLQRIHDLESAQQQTSAIDDQTQRLKAGLSMIKEKLDELNSRGPRSYQEAEDSARTIEVSFLS